MQDQEDYYISEWEMYWASPERQGMSLAAVAGRQVSKVLDVGCGAGQELLPFVMELGASGTGVDVSLEAVRVAYQQFAQLGYTKAVDFHCCPAESLPFEECSFDVVTCRLALPYTCNQMALSEIARVLKPNGLLILKIHHAHFYLRRLGRNLATGDIKMFLYMGRVLFAGLLYHVTGWQPNGRILKKEVFQTRWMLRRVLTSVGLATIRELHDVHPNPWTPTFLIQKTDDLRGRCTPNTHTR